MAKDELESIKKELTRLNSNLRKSNSLKGSFVRGIVSGLGTAIGATLIAALGITIALKILQLTGTERLFPQDFFSHQDN